MPTIHIHMLVGRSLEQKRALVKSVTEALVKTINVDPNLVTIFIHEVEKENLAKAGILYTDR